MGDYEVRDGGEMEGRRMRGKRNKMRWKRTHIIIHAKTEGIPNQAFGFVQLHHYFIYLKACRVG